jgi:hypothetical protein
LIPTLLSVAALSTAHAGAIEGWIVDTDGRPVADCDVTAINPRLEAVRTTTDAAGGYAFPDLPPGHYRLWAMPPQGDNRLARYHPDARTYCDGAAISIVGDHSDAAADFRLPLGAHATGTIVDLDGIPVHSAGVTAVPADQPAATRYGSTDSDGAFSIAGLDVADDGAAQWTIRVAVSGWPVQWLGPTYEQEDAAVFDVGPTGATDVGNHALLDGIFVAGTVADPDGPVPGATVRVYSNSQLVQTTTDDLGRYEASGLPPGDVLPWASAEGRGVTYFPDADRPVSAVAVPDEGAFLDDADLDMPFEAAFHGRVVTAHRHVDLTQIAVLLYNDTHTVGRGALADADGRFFIDQLHGGEYHIFVYAADAGFADAWVRDADGGYQLFSVDDETIMPSVDIPLRPAVRVEGTVVDENGVPVANTAVILTDAVATGPAEQAETAHIAQTDGEGYYRVAGLPPGQWDIRALVDPICPGDPGYVPVYWPQQVDPLLWEPIELREGDPTFIARFDLPRDDDYDQMSDRWERRYDLDTTRNDSLGDPDQDGIANLDEYRQGRDPRSPDGDWFTVRRCACATGMPGSGSAVLIVAISALFRRRQSDSLLV